MKKCVALVLLSLSITAFSKVVSPDLDEGMNFRFSAEVSDPARSLASESDKPEKKVEGKIEGADKERSVASDLEVEDKVEKSGIQFWKY